LSRIAPLYVYLIILVELKMDEKCNSFLAKLFFLTL